MSRTHGRKRARRRRAHECAHTCHANNARRRAATTEATATLTGAPAHHQQAPQPAAAPTAQQRQWRCARGEPQPHRHMIRAAPRLSHAHTGKYASGSRHRTSRRTVRGVPRAAVRGAVVHNDAHGRARVQVSVDEQHAARAPCHADVVAAHAHLDASLPLQRRLRAARLATHRIAAATRPRPAPRHHRRHRAAAAAATPRHQMPRPRVAARRRLTVPPLL